MSFPSTEKDVTHEQQHLLKTYEPTLWFTKEERFFPMDVDDYVGECVLRDKNRNQFKGGEPKLTVTDLKNLPNEYYLHYIHDISRVNIAFITVSILLIGILFGAMWYSGHPSQINLQALGDERSWPQLWQTPLDDIKMGFLLILLAIFWPLFQGNRRVHFMLFLAFMFFLFLGKPIGIGFGLLAFLMTLIILFLFLFLPFIGKLLPLISQRINKIFTGRLKGVQGKISQTSQNITDALSRPITILEKWSEPLAKGFFMFALVALTASVVYPIFFFVSWLGNVVLEFNEPLTVDTGKLLLNVPLPSDFVSLINLVFIVIIVNLLIWYFLSAILVRVLKKIIKRKDWKKIPSKWTKEIASILVLLCALITLGLMWSGLKILGILADVASFNDGRTVAYALLAATATSALLEFFVDPFTLLEERNPISLFKTEIRQSTERSSPNHLTILTKILLGLIFYLVFSFYIAFPDSSPFDRIPEPFIQIGLPLIFITSLLLLFYIAIGASGPQLPGFIMNLLSQDPDFVALWAEKKYLSSVAQKDEKNKFCYYGRILTDNTWTILQYHYFYAFNDWRNICGGFNQHEGDWESVAIFLENPITTEKKPFGVACSQHQTGKFRFWEEVHTNGNHPIIFVALGSHANYFNNGVKDAQFHFPRGLTREIVEGIDTIVGRFRGTPNGLPEELATGDGEKIDRWKCCPITDNEPDWITYKGLWGQKSKMLWKNAEGSSGESGPTGPKWQHPSEILLPIEKSNTGKSSPPVLKPEKGGTRPRWHLHPWKDVMLLDLMEDDSQDSKKRLKALKHLVEREID